MRSAPARTVRAAAGWRLADVYLACAALFVAELAIVAVLERRQFAGLFEAWSGVQQLSAIALAVCAPIAAVWSVAIELGARARASTPRTGLALLAAAAAGTVAWSVSAGRHLEGAARPAFVAVVALAAALAAWMLGPRAAGLLAAPPGAAPRIAGIATAAIVLLEIVNATVLPRLYPGFHMGVGALALGAAAFAGAAGGASPGTSPRARLARATAALALFALGSALTPRVARILAPADNVRFVFATHAPLGAGLVRVAAALVPPPPLAEDDSEPAPAPSRGAVDLSGRDIVLITVDALRADHVGSYGYARPVTPNLDRLAAAGVVFDAAYTATPHTSYAVASLLTGKYFRPLALQGLGDDSETLALLLRRYGYRTAAFYPPAVFFIDGARFGELRDRRLDFEYAKVEFAPAALRAEQVRGYLESAPRDKRLFLWVHMFEPHEPYEAHDEHAFGDRDVDRYDSEIAAADAGLGAVVDLVRARDPRAVVIATADHGEEFLDHGGRYHGTTVYEEQVRVPLVVSAPGVTAPRHVSAPVQLVDIMPTLLSALDVPRPARIRGTDLSAWLTPAASPADPRGLAFCETDEQTLLARGSLRLVCLRRVGACALYDVARDPGQLSDIAAAHPTEVGELRALLRAIDASHGRLELRGLRAEGKGWPDAIRRGLAGDGDAAADVAGLLEDADVQIRRKAAELLFELRRPEAAPPLRVVLVRDEDAEVRRWAALALTRLGDGAPLVRDLVADPDPRWRRLAALALAEAGDDRGEDVLIAWWREAFPSPRDHAAPPAKPVPFERAREISAALAKIKSKAAVLPLVDALGDLRLRPHVAKALADIGDDVARPPLAAQLAVERSQTSRVALAEALVRLGAGPELVAPLRRFLGTPDPLPGGLGLAAKAAIVEHIGGPRSRDIDRLRRFARAGVAVGYIVPKSEAMRPGLRVLCRARAEGDAPGEIRFGAPTAALRKPSRSDNDSLVPKDAPVVDPARSVTLTVPGGRGTTEPFATLPAELLTRPGDYADFVVYATQNVSVELCAVVPLTEEIPPPPPEPWRPEEAPDGGSSGALTPQP